MLPTAMSNLSSPCLGKVWSEQYTAFGGLFVLISSLFMHWIEFIAVEHNERRMREAATNQGIQEVDMDLGGLGATGVAAAPCPGHIVTIVEERPCHDSCSSVSSCDSDYSRDGAKANPSITKSIGSSITKASPQHTDSSRMPSQETRRGEHDHAQGHGKKQPSDHSHGHEHDHKDVVRTKSHHHHTQEVGHSHAHGLSLLDESQRRISTYILEAGIAAHSVIIGVSLGVSSGAEFTGLLIALIFHQFFEGKKTMQVIYPSYYLLSQFILN